jgi:hypothetical protein
MGTIGTDTIDKETLEGKRKVVQSNCTSGIAISVSCFIEPLTLDPLLENIGLASTVVLGNVGTCVYAIYEETNRNYSITAIALCSG